MAMIDEIKRTGSEVRRWDFRGFLNKYDDLRGYRHYASARELTLPPMARRKISIVHIHRICPNVSETISANGRCHKGGAQPFIGKITP